MDRRGFLGLILAAGVAPAIVRAGSIMRVRPVLQGGSVLWEAAASTFAGGSIYLAADGSDANDGLSWATAKRTFSGLSLIEGATVYVGSGHCISVEQDVMFRSCDFNLLP